MKKVLLTASALSLLAGAAAADVTVGGDARFGLTYNTDTSNTNVDQRYRVFFNASTETDGGLTFGASVRLDTRNTNGAQGFGGDHLNNVITVSGNGFSFALGNTNGAVIETVGLWAGGLGFDATIGRPAIVGGFDGDGNDDQTVRVGYSFGDFNVMVSTASATQTDVELAASYSANGIMLAVGGDTDENYAISGSYAAGDYKVGAIYRSDEQYRVYGTYAFGSTTVGATYTKPAGDAQYGIGVSQSLGGGVTAHGAVGAGGGATLVQIGMTMNF